MGTARASLKSTIYYRNSSFRQINMLDFELALPTPKLSLPTGLLPRGGRTRGAVLPAQ